MIADRMDSLMSKSGKTAPRGERSDKTVQPRRTRGFAAASAAAKSPVRLAANRRGIAEIRLLTHWPDIAGARLAAISRPSRVKHRGGVALGGVLELIVEGSRLSEIEHELAQIVERVNAFYGYSAIVDIRLIRASAPLPPLTRPKRQARITVADLPKDRRAALQGMTGPIRDDALRDALSRLGANVLARGEARARAAADAERPGWRGAGAELET